MRFVHSLSTRPLEIQLYDTNALKRLIGNVWFYSLSVAYLKSLNQEVVLYTDELGKALLGHLPYDEIYTTLNNITDEYSPRFWALGKMLAIEQEPLGSVHIDGDVFIKKQSLVDRIEQGDWDMIVQNKEKFEDNYRDDISTLWKDVEFCKQVGLTLGENGAYNTGTLGFRNADLKKKFIDGYKKLVLHFSRLYSLQLHVGRYSTPDLIAEQQYVYLCAKSEGAKVECVLKNYIEDLEDLSNEASNIGYQHIITSAKYACVDKAKSTLKKHFPEIYNKTFMLCRNI